MFPVCVHVCTCMCVHVYAQMLLEAEEENDVKAAKRAGAEQAAELAEFDENFLQNQASEYEVGVVKLRTCVGMVMRVL